jgi:hypothetical protein
MKPVDKPSTPKTPGKPYRRPVLEQYGTIRELTKVTGGNFLMNDNAPKQNKTG